jgi:hypothetical protein
MYLGIELSELLARHSCIGDAAGHVSMVDEGSDMATIQLETRVYDVEGRELGCAFLAAENTYVYELTGDIRTHPRASFSSLERATGALIAHVQGAL